jgi:hypothetical protein
MIDKLNDYINEKRFNFDEPLERLMKCKTDKEKLSIINEIIAQKREAERIFYDLYEIINKKGGDN